MSSQPTVAGRVARHRRPLAVAALATLLAAGCTGGTSPGSPVPAVAPPSLPASPPSTAVPSPDDPGPATPASATPAVSPAASPSIEAGPMPAAPPVATIESPGGAPGPGALGSYTWAQAGSDAPWIVPRARDAVTGTGPWQVSFEPPLEAASWRVTWHPIEDGARGPLAGTAEGTGAIAFDGPGAGGPWSLRLEAAFGTAGRAAWYWRLAP